jgi:putative heme transporter
MAERRGLNHSLAALLLLAVFGLVGFALWFIVPRFIDQTPHLAENVEQALADLERWLGGLPVALPFDIGQGAPTGLAERAFGADGGDGASVLDQGPHLARRLTEFATSTLLFLIALFFYLRDGERIWTAATGLLPYRAWWHAHRVCGQLGWTLGAYFRG